MGESNGGGGGGGCGSDGGGLWVSKCVNFRTIKGNESLMSDCTSSPVTPSFSEQEDKHELRPMTVRQKQGTKKRKENKKEREEK